MNNSRERLLERFSQMNRSEYDNFPIEELKEDWQKEIYVRRGIQLDRRYFVGLVLPPGEPAESKKYGSFSANYRKTFDGKWELSIGGGTIPGHYFILPRFLTYEKFVDEAKEIGLDDKKCAKLKAAEGKALT